MYYLSSRAPANSTTEGVSRNRIPRPRYRSDASLREARACARIGTRGNLGDPRTQRYYGVLPAQDQSQRHSLDRAEESAVRTSTVRSRRTCEARQCAGNRSRRCISSTLRRIATKTLRFPLRGIPLRSRRAQAGLGYTSCPRQGGSLLLVDAGWAFSANFRWADHPTTILGGRSCPSPPNELINRENRFPQFQYLAAPEVSRQE